MGKQRVVIVGGSSGMGLSSAKLLAGLGYEVILGSRSREKLDKALQEVEGAKAYPIDVLQEDSIVRFFASIGPVDHLVITASDFIMGPFQELAVEKAKHFFDSKFWGQYLVAKHAAVQLKSHGTITFFSGIAGHKAVKNLSVAASINQAIGGLTRVLALELAPIRVNAIAPGMVATPIWDGVPVKEREAFFKEAGSSLPVRRVGEAKDIAQVVRFLIECGYMTGEVVCCDGGDRLI
ncbi:MAG: SDR family oxidoreductase [Chlamydiales bacterium]|nr:SDR family oxidoreductase [Chlamydiales bacterium]